MSESTKQEQIDKTPRITTTGIILSLLVSSLFLAPFTLYEAPDEFKNLNWLPGTFTNIQYFADMTNTVGLCFVALSIILSAIWKRYIASLVLILLLVARFSIPAEPMLSRLDVGRYAGHYLGVAKKECWIPESWECKAGKGIDDLNAPRIWDGDMTEWGAEQTKKLLSER